MAVDEAFKRWWDADFSWEGLAKKPWHGGPEGKTLQDYWRSEADSLTTFAGRDWTRFHLPLHDPEGNRSPKANWSQDEVERVHHDIVQLAIDGASENAPMAVLGGIVTCGDISFSERTINANFALALFSGTADFGSATFSGIADFGSATFSEDAYFGSATFSGDAYFRSATFSGGAYFRSAMFSGDADFGDAAFLGIADFGVGEIADSDHATTSSGFQSVTFADSVFLDDVTFENRAFRRAPSFARAAFHGVAEFHNATLHDGTSFFEAEFGIPPRPLALTVPSRLEPLQADLWRQAISKIETEREAYAPLNRRERQQLRGSNEGDDAHHDLRERRKRRDERLDRFESAFRRLKNEMARLQDRSKERFFFTFEMQCSLAKSTTKPMEKAAGWVYRRTSNYGNSLARPLGAILVLALIMTVLSLGLYSLAPPAKCEQPPASVATLFSTACPMTKPPVSFRDGAVFLAQSTLPVFLFASLDSSGSAGAPTFAAQLIASPSTAGALFIFASILHAVLNIVLWFLFALALRRRFQID